MSEVTFSGNTVGDKAIYLTGVARGEKNEQERIIKLLEKTPFLWMGDVQLIQLSRDDLIALIKGEPKDV